METGYCQGKHSFPARKILKNFFLVWKCGLSFLANYSKKFIELIFASFTAGPTVAFTSAIF